MPLACALLFGVADFAFAQTGTTTASVSETNRIISDLQAQIADLNAKIAALKQARDAVKTSEEEVLETLKLIGSLREGMTSEQVTMLQEILASDPGIYPEGLVTGYYGKLTAKAIQKFRDKYERRQEKMTEHMKNRVEKMKERLAKAEERIEKKEDRMEKKFARKFCNIPPGLLTAPGYQKTHRDEWNHLLKEWLACMNAGDDGDGDDDGDDDDDDNGTTTPDTAAPVISSLSVSSLTHAGATISWNTNENATGKVYWSAVSPLNTSTASAVSNSSLTMGHSFSLAGLSANTTYYFVVESKDAAGNTSTSSEGTFITLALPDTTPPVISEVSVGSITATTASISWTTNESATSKAYYGTTTPINLASALTISDSAPVTSHALSLAGLSASTTYYFITESKDSSGNGAVSSEGSFNTAP